MKTIAIGIAGTVGVLAMAALGVNVVFTPVGSHGVTTQLQVRQAQPAAQLAPAMILPAPATTQAPVVDTSASTQAPATTAPAANTDPKAHPCNHGFYVAQAAHGHKGGAYVATIAQGSLGKDGNCTAPLPAQVAPVKSDHEGSDGAEHESGD